MTIVAIDEDAFEAAHIADERWNGFACPYFTRTEADKVAAWTVRLHEEFGDDAELVTWDVTRNAYVATSGGWEPGEEVLYEAVYLPGFTGPLFAIGAWAWTWQEATHDESPDRATHGESVEPVFYYWDAQLIDEEGADYPPLAGPAVLAPYGDHTRRILSSRDSVIGYVYGDEIADRITTHLNRTEGPAS